ncbi:MAG TPA: protein kinase [Kofleriaceae bacterium]|nr:protein kinase [Kofleriaceae bacterium]
MSSKPPPPPGDDLAEANTELRISTGLEDTIAAPSEPDDPFEDDDTVLAEHSGGVVRTRWARGSALAEAPDASRLGNYRVVSPVSEGRSGAMYLGEHALLRYRVAVKILPPPLRGNAELEKRLLAEAVTMARVSHPGVPTVLDFGQDAAGSAYLVMEYMEGEPLAACLARGIRFSLAQVIELGAQVAAALAAAHASGVVHGDLQPGSIHVCPAPASPAGFRIKLLDFASAAPDAPADPRADVYSLGCVLLELTGPSRAALPPALDHLIHRMTARDPAHRPAMAEVEAALRAVAQTPPRAPAPISRPILALLAGIAVGLLIGFLLLNV